MGISNTIEDNSNLIMPYYFVLTAEAKCKQEERRKTAVLTYKYLAEHCSDPEAVMQLIKHMFGVLKGRLTGIIVVCDVNQNPNCYVKKRI